MGVRISRYSVQLVRESAGVYDLSSKQVKNPSQAAEVVRSLLNIPTLANEHFGAITLDTKNRVIGFHVLAIGSLYSTVVYPRNVFQAALLNNAASVILFHNHPSGDPTPSPEDVGVTKRMREVGRLMGIEVLDHIIVVEDKHVSICETHSLF